MTLESHRPFIEDLYRELHASPELSNREHRTAARMAAVLRQEGEAFRLRGVDPFDDGQMLVVIDDDAHVRVAMRRLLSSWGCRALVVDYRTAAGDGP